MNVEKTPAGGPDKYIGQMLGEYEVLQRIMGGRSGGVYKGKHRTDGRVVSLKLLPPEAAGKGEAIKRFRREVEISSKLDHPHLIAAYEAGEQQGTHFLVMEFFAGTDLASIVAANGPLEVETAVDYLRQAGEALQYLHANGVYHRNVKPQNLLVDPRGRLKVANLLLARLEDGSALAEPGEDLTKTGEMMGSADYLPPEQATDASRIDQRADIYALGCTMYHLLTGRPPFSGSSLMDKLMAHRSSPIPSLQAARPDVPPSLDRLNRQMLAKQPGDRPASMGAVLSRLEGGLPRWALWLVPVVGVLTLAILAAAIWWR